MSYISETIAAFRALHADTRVLILPNAWDAASAALFVSVGAKAIATTSGGVAWACGFADGDALPQENLLFAVRKICRVATGTPVSVDIESGYSGDPDEVAELVGKLSALGVAGVNIEDGTGAPELLAAKIVAVRRTNRKSDRDIFINARIDVFLRNLAAGEATVYETVSRAERYAQAGADGIFVPMVHDRDAIRTIARATNLPLNVLAVPGLPSPHELFELGVRRLSAGTSLAELAFGTARHSAAAFVHGEISYELLFSEQAVEYGEMNALLVAAGRPKT